MFDIPYDRARARLGIKWTKHGTEVVPAWVADMDFDPPPAVLATLQGYLRRGDLGYARLVDDLAPTYASWQREHHGWDPDVEHIRVFTSALHALETALWNTTSPGDGVVVFTPIYYPFLDAIDTSGRRLVDVPLDPNGWRIDPDRLEAAIDADTKVVLFCTPHNPTGRVFDQTEIAAVAEVAERHDLLVISDEIWGDLTHDVPHRPLAVCDDRFAGRLMTLGSASKTFNIAGLRCAVAHVDHATLNTSLDAMPGHLQGAPSTLGVAATLASWQQCDEWLAELKHTLRDRRDHLRRRLAERVPAVGFEAPEATYLAWLDFAGTGLGPDPAAFLVDRAGVALSPGPQFGSGGDGFARLNFATSTEILDDMVDRIEHVLVRSRL